MLIEMMNGQQFCRDKEDGICHSILMTLPPSTLFPSRSRWRGRKRNDTAHSMLKFTYQQKQKGLLKTTALTSISRKQKD